MNYNDRTVKTLEDWSFPEISNGKDGLTFKMSEKLKPLLSFLFCYYGSNHNHNKILKSDWLSTVLISALIGQCNRTVRVMPVIGQSTRSYARA